MLAECEINNLPLTTANVNNSWGVSFTFPLSLWYSTWGTRTPGVREDILGGR
jgi:hypothetical protein